MSSAALLLALAGCGDEQTTPEPQLGGSPTEETSGGTSEDPTNDPTEAAEPFDDEGYETHRGRINATTAAQRAVADAWVDYWEYAGEAYYKVKVDSGRLGKVAQGDAASMVVGYVDQLSGDGEHTEGDVKVGVSEVTVADGYGAVVSCIVNKSSDRYEDGTVAGTSPRFSTMVGTLVKVDETWLVEQWQVRGTERCQA